MRRMTKLELEAHNKQLLRHNGVMHRALTAIATGKQPEVEFVIVGAPELGVAAWNYTIRAWDLTSACGGVVVVESRTAGQLPYVDVFYFDDWAKQTNDQVRLSNATSMSLANVANAINTKRWELTNANR